MLKRMFRFVAVMLILNVSTVWSFRTSKCTADVPLSSFEATALSPAYAAAEFHPEQSKVHRTISQTAGNTRRVSVQRQLAILKDRLFGTLNNKQIGTCLPLADGKWLWLFSTAEDRMTLLVRDPRRTDHRYQVNWQENTVTPPQSIQREFETEPIIMRLSSGESPVLMISVGDNKFKIERENPLAMEGGEPLRLKVVSFSEDEFGIRLEMNGMVVDRESQEAGVNYRVGKSGKNEVSFQIAYFDELVYPSNKLPTDLRGLGIFSSIFNSVITSASPRLKIRMQAIQHDATVDVLKESAETFMERQGWPLRMQRSGLSFQDDVEDLLTRAFQMAQQRGKKTLNAFKLAIHDSVRDTIFGRLLDEAHYGVELDWNLVRRSYEKRSLDFMGRRLKATSA